MVRGLKRLLTVHTKTLSDSTFLPPLFDFLNYIWHQSFSNKTNQSILFYFSILTRNFHSIFKLFIIYKAYWIEIYKHVLSFFLSLKDYAIMICWTF